MTTRAVCYVADRGFMLPTLVAARQLRRFVKPDKASIFIFAVDQDEARVRAMNALVKPYGLDIVALDSRHFSATDCAKIESTHVSIATLGRFFIADLLPESCQTITYMDGDTWAARDPSRLIEWDIAEGRLGAVEDGSMSFERYDLLGNGKRIRAYLRGLNIGFDRGYFNAGLLHVARKTWKQISADAFDFFCSHADICLLRDQSALNAVAGDRSIPLSLQWNFQSFYKLYGFDRLVTPSICHFIGAAKPWLGPVYPWQDFTPAFERVMAELEPLGIPRPSMDTDKLKAYERQALAFDWRLRHLFHLRRWHKNRLVERYMASAALKD